MREFCFVSQISNSPLEYVARALWAGESARSRGWGFCLLSVEYFFLVFSPLPTCIVSAIAHPLKDDSETQRTVVDRGDLRKCSPKIKYSSSTTTIEMNSYEFLRGSLLDAHFWDHV